MKKQLRCKKYQYLKCYAVVYQNYYCNHEDRVDDMGKLTDYHLHRESSKWCPKRIGGIK